MNSRNFVVASSQCSIRQCFFHSSSFFQSNHEKSRKQPADLVFAEKPVDDVDLVFIFLLADRFHFIVNAGHPLASCNTVMRADLAKQPCLLLRTSNHGRKRLEDFLTRRDIELSRTGEIESVNAIKEMVKKLPVMSILPGWTVAKELKNKTFVSLPVQRKPFEQTWGIIHSRTRSLNHAESAFLKFCRQQVTVLD
jgi:DNA-binding transcriptional LysR family regulator